MKKSIDEIAHEDGRFSPRAIRFVYDGLGYTARKMVTEPGHVSGQKLCEGLRQMAIERYGRLARLVLVRWDIKSTRDFGEIVYLMIRNEWMSAQPTDTIEDFDDVYDFTKVFKEQFEF